MDPDLQGMLQAWLGDDADATRQAELLQRLRTDEAFRLAFVEEIRLLGMLQAVQATEPRWLTLEDALGPPPTQSVPTPVEVRPAPQPVQRRASGRWKVAMLAASLLVAAVPLWLLFRGDPAVLPTAREAPTYVAVVVKLDSAKFDPSAGPAPTEGKPIPSGQLRLQSGKATITLFNGVMLSVQGPANLDLTSVDRIFCHEGKLRARVPMGSEGFVVRAPGAAVVDLGTEFGLNVDSHGKSEMMVFEGKAEVSLLNAEGKTLRSELVEGQRAASIDPSAGLIREVAAVPEAFVSAPELISPTLALDPTYADVIRKANPWGYWRFDVMNGGLVQNDIPGRPGLRATGPIVLSGLPGENRAAHFTRTDAEQHFIMDDSWTPPRKTGYAIECWTLPEEVSAATLVGLYARSEEPAQKHVGLLELTGRGHHLVHDACVLRFLDRWPPAHSGGVNVFSRGMYVPYRWHHIVARRLPDTLELYLNGEFVGSSPTDSGDFTTPARVIVGRLKYGKQPQFDQIRPFIGRIDELAIYDTPLSPEEIIRHSQLGSMDLPGLR